MVELAALPLLKIVICGGFSVWSLVAAYNNVVGFAGSVAAISATMSMSPLREQPPIETQFDGRRVRSLAVPKFSVVCVLLLQAAAGALLALAAIGFVGISPIELAPQQIGQWGFSLLMIAWFAMLVGGLWFGYWIRQDALQMTHLALLIATMIAAALVNG
jgi:predicted small integral membrane protein